MTRTAFGIGTDYYAVPDGEHRFPSVLTVTIIARSGDDLTVKVGDRTIDAKAKFLVSGNGNTVEVVQAGDVWAFADDTV